MKKIVTALVPLTSRTATVLQRAEWSFARPGTVDRGDGYTYYSKLCPEAAVESVLDYFDRHYVTAWATKPRGWIR